MANKNIVQNELKNNVNPQSNKSQVHYHSLILKGAHLIFKNLFNIHVTRPNLASNRTEINVLQKRIAKRKIRQKKTLSLF